MKTIRTLLYLFVGCMLSRSLLAQSSAEADMLTHFTGRKLVIRFFYDPGMYFHAPLILYVVRKDDRRLSMSELHRSHRRIYVTEEEMSAVRNGLLSINLPWRKINHPIRLVDPTKQPPLDEMEITLGVPDSSAITFIPPENICDRLMPLITAFSPGRALWEFKMFLHGYKCKAPNLSKDPYPDAYLR